MQEVRQKRNISEHRSPLSPCATFKGPSYATNEYNRFHQKLDAEYFFILQFFQKKTVFSEKTVKNCFGSTFDYFLGKGGILRQKLI